MGIKDKINFRQPKYMLPAIIYFPLLFFGYFFFRFFDTEKAEVNNKMQTTEYYNDKLPDANLKGDGIGDKYSNMVNNFGKIKDESAVENIERGNEDQKEEYNSQYSDAEVAAMDQQSDEAQQSMERLRRLQAQIKEQQAKDENVTGSRISAILKTRNKPLKISARHWKKLRMRANLMSEPQKEVLRNTTISPLKKSRRTTMKTKRS